MTNMSKAFEKAGVVVTNADKASPPSTRGNNPDTRSIEAKELPADYVGEAETVMIALGRRISDEKIKFDITTSKMRNFLSLINEIYNTENISNLEVLSEKSIRKLQMLRVRMLYEAGRDMGVVKPFLMKAKLLEYLLDIGESREKFINYAHYMEALVAYHRFYGGTE